MIFYCRLVAGATHGVGGTMELISGVCLCLNVFRIAYKRFKWVVLFYNTIIMENLSDIIHRVSEETGVSDIVVAQILKEWLDYGVGRIMHLGVAFYVQYNLVEDGDYLDSFIFPSVED